MNGDWFPWSGWFYGADELVGDAPDQWEGPEHFKKAYRYVVDRVRARGAANIKWMFHTNNYSYPLDTWNFAAAYYPGPEYADWLGLSVYGQQFKDEPWANIPSLVDWPYEEMSRLDPKTPIMIAEWATGEFPRSGNKGAWIQEGLDLFRTRYPRVKGGNLLARALAESGSNLQQPARQFVGRIAQRLSERRRPSGLAGKFDSASAGKRNGRPRSGVILLLVDRALRARWQSGPESFSGRFVNIARRSARSTYPLRITPRATRSSDRPESRDAPVTSRRKEPPMRGEM